MDKSIIVGLDIGIASVGVGIIEKETGKILHASSRLFPAANADNNKERRGFRQSRRLLRRRQRRVSDIYNLFYQYQLLEEGTTVSINDNPYQLRVKGLSQALSNEELLIALRTIVKRRGISYLDDAEDDGAGSGSDYSKAIQLNQSLLEGKTPGQIQFERLERYGQLRGDFTITNEQGETVRIINVFSTSDYKNEAIKILEQQKLTNSKVTDDFINAILSLISRKRAYYIGPGNELSRTDYGIYRTDGRTLKNIFKVLIGKCSYYPEEYRASKSSYTAQEFNFLNDLNNLTVPTETGKLTCEQKEMLVNVAKNSKTFGPKKLLKEIIKLTGGNLDDIKGYRQDAKDAPDIHTFEPYRKMKSTLNIVDIDMLTRNELDNVAHILTINTETPAIRQAMKDKFGNRFSEEEVDDFVNARKKLSLIFGKGWHNFSVKLMEELIPELYQTSKEQMTILSDSYFANKKKANQSRSVKTKYISEDDVVDEIYNPVVVKSVRQSIKILNHILKKYEKTYHIDKIVIEMARESNEDDVKKQKETAQKENAKQKSEALKKAANALGRDDLPNDVFKQNRSLETKIRLWYQQGERCLYTGRVITAHDLVYNPNLFEIDHILPLSLSFDDSLSNKVLVYSTANQEKGQKTPFQSIPTMKQAWSWAEFKDYVAANRKILGKKKVEYLLCQEYINKIEVKRQFIARNLVDTRYASRVVLNAFQSFFDDKDTTVSVVRGLFTAMLRRKWDLAKTRETYHHHAIDALIIAASTQLKIWDKLGHIVEEGEDAVFYDPETGEVLDVDNKTYQDLVYQTVYDGFVNTLKQEGFENEILFSYQVDSKVNRKVSDATIYGTRSAQVGKDKKPETYVIGKTSDIYTVEGYKDFKKVYDKDKTKFLMYHHDERTFKEVIETVLDQYPDKIVEGEKSIDVSPFKLYADEQGEYLRKYSKKGNGPFIKVFKYYDSKLGNALDITPKDAKNKVVLQSLKPWRTDVYFNPTTGKYELMGLKYADLSYEKGTGSYGISQEKYDEIKQLEGVSKHSEFKFTLYKNDLIMIKDTENKEEGLYRFLSRTLPNKKHYVELKPYDSAKFVGGASLITLLGTVSKGGQCIKGLAKPNLSIYKVRTDVLGNKFYIKKEGDHPVLSFKNRSKKS